MCPIGKRHTDKFNERNRMLLRSKLYCRLMEIQLGGAFLICRFLLPTRLLCTLRAKASCEVFSSRGRGANVRDYQLNTSIYGNWGELEERFRTRVGERLF